VSTQPPLPVVAPRQAAPLRIKRLSLTDFRAFPGPTPVDFHFNGKNLLVYGENGSGKSSIFHALSNFFQLARRKPLEQLKNVFSQQPVSDCAVRVEFDDGAPAANWDLVTVGGVLRERHPTVASGGNDARVISAALRSACLDYRALLDTNYKHGDGAINLFDIAVERLLADFPVSVGGAQRTVGELWRNVLIAKPMQHSKPALHHVNQACADFNSGFKQAVAAMQPLVSTLLTDLIGTDVVVQLVAPVGVTYSAARLRRDRKIDGRTFVLDVHYRNHSLTQPQHFPQHFLNEARLSALALAIYLAGRITCTPTATPGALKLLVMDDVLIGLDHSNRLPILDVLIKRFADWQVVLLTHDKTWFELARIHLPEDAWSCVEIYEGDSAATAPMPIPIVRTTLNRPAEALLQKAEDILKLGYVEAAANYVRQAFEYVVRGACELKKIEIPYLVDQKAYKTQVLLDKLKGWTATGKVKQADWDAALKRLEMLKDVVMNPYSHPSAPNIPKQEVTDAIKAVKAFLALVRKK
jgi:energy-coupling factor transporter ATP-binding protein EcfA2